MAKFCSKCGRPLAPGEVCNCTAVNGPTFDFSMDGETGQDGNAGQSYDQTQGYDAGQSYDQTQGYGNSQNTGQNQNYGNNQYTAQNQSYGGSQYTAQNQSYGGSQNTAQSQGYGGSQNTAQSQGYGGSQNSGQSQGYGGSQNTAQSQGYSGSQNYNRNQNYGSGQDGKRTKQTGNSYNTNSNYNGQQRGDDDPNSDRFFNNANQTFNAANAHGFFESMKNRMGIGDPELNKGDAFEKGKRIVPDCVKPDENEVPIRQYTVATLRKRVLGIPYMKAIGRIQATNKRVIFRAPGRCPAGRTTLQHEFLINDISGLEARREYAFALWALILGIIVTSIGGSIASAIINVLSFDSATASTILTFLFGIAGCVPFFLLKRKWLLKLLCLGCSCIPMAASGWGHVIYSRMSSFWGGSSGGRTFLGYLLLFLSLISLILIIITLCIYAIRPNLVLVIRPKVASAAIDIRRKKFIFGGSRDDHTGYTEIIPAEDAEKAIRELGALINDIQTYGDQCIDKWA